MPNFQPHWVYLENTPNPICCHNCGELVNNIWLCYTRPAIWTIAWCVPCTTEKITEHGAAEQTTIGAGETAP